MRRRDRVSDVQYLKWIRSLLCAVVSKKCRGSIEAHHAGVRGLGQRAEDNTAIPLCVKHHRLGDDSFHRLGRRFWTYHKLDREALIVGYQETFNMRPQMKIHLAIRGFVGRAMKFEDRLEVNESEIDVVIEQLGEKHAKAMAAHELHWIEIEFLDEPNPLERFFRFGTDPGGMVWPMRIK